MKLHKFAALALALTGLSTAPVVAAPIDYFLTVPLFSFDASGGVPDLTLRGTLTYDGDDAMTGHGSFTVGDAASEDFSGLTFLLNLSTETTVSMGLLFDGTSDAGSELYMNVATGAAATNPGMVTYCMAGGCSFYSAIGATMTSLAQTAPVGSSPSLPAGNLPGTEMSPVPLPPAMSLFGGALLLLGGAAACRRARPKTHAARG